MSDIEKSRTGSELPRIIRSESVGVGRSFRGGFLSVMERVKCTYLATGNCRCFNCENDVTLEEELRWLEEIWDEQE